MTKKEKNNFSSEPLPNIIETQEKEILEKKPPNNLIIKYFIEGEMKETEPKEN